jgi:hypothetical protein
MGVEHTNLVLEILAFPSLDIAFQLEVAQIIKVQLFPFTRHLRSAFFSTCDDSVNTFFGIEPMRARSKL